MIPLILIDHQTPLDSSPTLQDMTVSTHNDHIHPLLSQINHPWVPRETYSQIYPWQDLRWETPLSRSGQAASRHPYDEMLLRKIKYASGHSHHDGFENDTLARQPLTCIEMVSAPTQSENDSPPSVRSSSSQEDQLYQTHMYSVSTTGARHHSTGTYRFVEHPQSGVEGQNQYSNCRKRRRDESSSDVTCTGRSAACHTPNYHGPGLLSSNVSTIHNGLGVSMIAGPLLLSPISKYTDMLHTFGVSACSALCPTLRISPIHDSSSFISSPFMALRFLRGVAASPLGTHTHLAVNLDSNKRRFYMNDEGDEQEMGHVQARREVSSSRTLRPFRCSCCPRRARVFDTEDEIM